MQRQTKNQSFRDPSEPERGHVPAELFADSEIAPECWDAAGPLIDHIISNYHRPSVPLLSELWHGICAIVQDASKKSRAQFLALKACHGELQLDLAHQMMKEEIRLFPRLRRYERGPSEPKEQNGFLEIASLIRAAKADHRKTLELLSDIRQLLSSCADEASSSILRIGALFGQIDLHIRRRIYLQDEVLFPIIEEGRGSLGG